MLPFLLLIVLIQLGHCYQDLSFLLFRLTLESLAKWVFLPTLFPIILFYLVQSSLVRVNIQV